jgi:hypothetical protein
MERTLPLIKVMPVGTFTSVEGITVSFSEADLREAAEAYDPVTDPAPFVVGHPKLDHPAYGWAKGVVFQDGALCVEPDPAKLQPAFAEAVREGRYSKVSARFYTRTGRGNPKPGKLYLKHVGFLGAAAPSVKGLGTVSFAEEEAAGAITIDQPLENKAMADKDPNEVSFAERSAELDRREAEISGKETAIAAREKTAAEVLHASNISFAEGLVTGKKLPPAMKPLVIGLLDELDATATVSFGEGDAAEQLTPNAAFRKLFDGATATISFGEAAPADKGEDGKGTVSFAAPQGYEADPERKKIHDKALELQAGDPNLTYLQAVKRAGG